MGEKQTKQQIEGKYILRGIKKYEGKKEATLQQQLNSNKWNFTAYRFNDNRILLAALDDAYGWLYADETTLQAEIDRYPFSSPDNKIADKQLILGQYIEKGIQEMQATLDPDIQRHLDNANWKFTPYTLSDHRVMLVYPNKTFAVLYKSVDYLFEVMEETRFKE